VEIARLPELVDVVAECVQKLRHPSDMILMRMGRDD
jgi:hypothetical protein